jgi:uncharacterized membrane protein
LVASGAITANNARAIELHYGSLESRSNFGFILLAAIGSALIGAGIILLVAHNWDELSRGTRSAIAFMPLLLAQGLGVFVLMRRSESQPWRESVAIFDIAAVGAAISLISQTYQIQGTIADFICLWLLLSIPIVYLFQTNFGAVAYIIGTVAWVFAHSFSWFLQSPNLNLFWLLLLLIIPFYFGALHRDRLSRLSTILSILLLFAATAGLGFTVDAARANLGGIAFAGLFAAAYLMGIRLSGSLEGERLHPMALLSGIGAAVTAVILSFQSLWHLSQNSSGPATGIGIAIQLFFPIVAIALFVVGLWGGKRTTISVAVAVIPLVAAAAWLIASLAPAIQRNEDTAYSLIASLIFDVYALALGIELLTRGVWANGLVRANFGLLIIAAIAVARFFDSDLSFVIRGLGFIVIGGGFLAANIIFFRKRATA